MRQVVTNKSKSTIDAKNASTFRVLAFSVSGLQIGIVVCAESLYRLQWADGRSSKDYSDLESLIDDHSDLKFYELRYPGIK